MFTWRPAMEISKVFIIFSCFRLIDSSDLNDYIKTAKIDLKRGKVFKAIGNCLLRITSPGARTDQDVVVLFRNISHDDASLISINYPIVVITEAEAPLKRRYVRNGEIAYVFNTLPISELLGAVSWDSQTRFIVVCNSEKEAKDMFLEFWEERCANVLGLVYSETDTSIHLLTYFPYSQDHCRSVGHLKHVAVWHESDAVNMAQLFPDKVSNLHKCPFYVTLLVRPPSVIVTKSGKLTGVEVNILNLVARSLNATPVLQLLHGKKTTPRGRGNPLMLELTENLSDVVAGSLMFTTSVSLLSDGVQYPESLCIVVAVPMMKTQGYFYIFTTILSKQFLLWVLSTVSLSVFFLHAILKLKKNTTPFTTTTWFILSSVIGGPRVTSLAFFAGRSFFAAWLFSSFIFFRVFEASVSSTVLAPKPPKQLETIYDVLDTKLQIAGETFFKSEVIPRYLTKQKYDRVVPFSMPDREVFRGVGIRRTLAYLGTKTYLWHLIDILPEFKDQIYIPDKCLMKYQPVIQIRKHSPFSSVVTKHINALSESGIIHTTFDAYAKEILQKENIIETQILPLTKKQLAGAFLILILGHALSFSAFLAERFWVKLIKKPLKREVPRRHALRRLTLEQVWSKQ